MPQSALEQEAGQVFRSLKSTMPDLIVLVPLEQCTTLSNLTLVFYRRIPSSSPLHADPPITNAADSADIMLLQALSKETK